VPDPSMPVRVIYIYEAGDEQELRAMYASDPFCTIGVWSPDVYVVTAATPPKQAS
jgi:uncharacterized protein YciI